MLDWLANNSEADAAAAMETNLKDVFRERNGDNCSLGIAVQQPHPSDMLHMAAGSGVEPDHSTS
jgi:hypothetical protein